jgi:heavy metal sensor kinase
MSHRRLLTVRARLTLWNLGVMMVVLGVYAAGIYTLVSRNLSTALDERLRSDFSWAAEMWQQRPDGSFTWFEHDPVSQESPWLTVWSPDGHVKFQTTSAKWFPIAASERLAAQAKGSIEAVPGDGATFRVLTSPSRLANQPFVLQVARSEAPMQMEIRELVLYLGLGLPLAVLVAGAGGYLMARHALRPAERMAEQARLITAERLSERLPVDNPHDEFGRLATVFNDTFARLEGVFGQMQRFTSDVSHELRTPLTAIRTVGEVGLRDRRDERTYREIIGSMLEEVDRLALLVSRLLTWSRIDSGQARPAIEPIDVREATDDVAAQLGVLAEEKQQTIEVTSAGRPRALADPILLRQALTNVVDNAIKYGPEGGCVDIRMFATGPSVVIDVSDNGPGIPPQREALIFERFYRGSTSGSSDGVGLGLSIAKRALDAFGGRLHLEKATRGCTFRITLPAAPAASQAERLKAAG